MGTHLQSLKSNLQNVNTRKNKTKMAEQDWAEEVVAEAAEEMAMEEDLTSPSFLVSGIFQRFSAKTWPSQITSNSIRPMPSTFHTTPADSTRPDSERLSATLSSDLSTPSCKKAETTVRRCFRCES